MSFILDALQKSEAERHGRNQPSFADVPIRARRAERPWWMFAVAGLLIVNLGVLGVVLLRGRSADSRAAAEQVTKPTVANATPGQPRARSIAREPSMYANTGSDAGRAFAEEAGALSNHAESSRQAGFDPAPDPAAMQAAAEPQRPDRVQPRQGSQASPVSPPSRLAPGALGATSSAPPSELLPTINDLTAKGAVLPDLHVDLHVYSNKPAERFVFINKQKYLEGQALKEGPTVEQITPDGIELNNGGTRFLLPRQ